MDIIILATLVILSFQAKILVPYLIFVPYVAIYIIFWEKHLGINDTIIPQLCSLILNDSYIFVHLPTQYYLAFFTQKYMCTNLQIYIILFFLFLFFVGHIMKNILWGWLLMPITAYIYMQIKTQSDLHEQQKFVKRWIWVWIIW